MPATRTPRRCKPRGSGWRLESSSIVRRASAGTSRSGGHVAPAAGSSSRSATPGAKSSGCPSRAASLSISIGAFMESPDTVRTASPIGRASPGVDRRSHADGPRRMGPGTGRRPDNLIQEVGLDHPRAAPLERAQRSSSRSSGSSPVAAGLSNMPRSGPPEILTPGEAHRRAGRKGLTPRRDRGERRPSRRHPDRRFRGGQPTGDGRVLRDAVAVSLVRGRALRQTRPEPHRARTRDLRERVAKPRGDRSVSRCSRLIAGPARRRLEHTPPTLRARWPE
jgi:hypothetical protein